MTIKKETAHNNAFNADAGGTGGVFSFKRSAPTRVKAGVSPKKRITEKTMQLIRFTKKLQKEMGLNNASLSKAEPTFSHLGSWHANLIFVDRRKCVLFVNDKTLLNFIVPDVSRAQIKILSSLFTSYLACVLADEGIPEHIREKLMAEYSNIEYSNTNSKSILGSMNDLAFQYEYHILSEGGVHSSAVPGIIKKLNRMPMRAIEYAYPIEALKALYSKTT